MTSSRRSEAGANTLFDMVLYKRKAIILPEPKTLPVDLNIEVWHIDETGEWYATYEEYLERLDFYARHHFTCEITGTSCLTFFEALDSEETQFKYVEERFPLKLREPVARFLHFNGIKRLDVLVEKVYSRFKNDFFPGETVYLRKTSKDSSEPLSNQATPQPDEALFKNPRKDESTQPQYQKPYIIKEKAHFNATKDPDTEEIIMPAYSKYMLMEENHGHKSLIADQSQLYRDRSTFTKHLIKCFCKITLKRASSKMGAPWAVKEEYLPMYGLTMDWPPEMLKYKEDEVLPDLAKNKRSRSSEDGDDIVQEEDDNMDDLEGSNKENEEEELNKKRKTEVSKEDANIHETPVINTITSIAEDLALPFQGPANILETLFHYNEFLESVPLNSSRTFKPFKKIERLLQVFQFLNTFGSRLYLSSFNLDQFITSIKCTDPQELKGEFVHVELGPGEHKPEEVKKVLSDWERNPYFRQFIESKNSKYVSYQIVKDEPASEEVIDNINQNGTGLLIETFIALLRLFIDEKGDWQVLVAEEWLSGPKEEYGTTEDIVKDEEKGEKEEVVKEEIVEKEEELEEEEGHDDVNFDAELNSCLNYRNVNWAERLSKRQFNNGFWLIILLGIFESCIHIPTYTQIVSDFNEKIIPKSISSSQLPKQLWRNFCYLSFEEKLNALWILVDLVSNFSPDIKSALETSMDLCGQIRSERFRVAKDLKSETTTLSILQMTSESMKQEPPKDISAFEEIEKKIEDQKLKIENLQKDKSLLGMKLMENDLQRLKPLGIDRYGNKYYWMDLSGVIIPDIEEVTGGSNNQHQLAYHTGRVWIQGPCEAAAKFFLKISSEDIKKWDRLVLEKDSTYATKEVFHIYRATDGSYRHFDEGGETELVNAEKVLNPLIELTPIQRKIIDESPECVLLTDKQWYSIDRLEDLRRLLDWLDTWGRREHDLLRQFKTLELYLESTYLTRERRLDLFKLDDVEEKLLRELKENEFTVEELNLDEANVDEDHSNGSLSPSGTDDPNRHEQELEDIAEEIMKLDDCSKTRKILNKIQELERRRDQLLEAKQAIDDSMRPGARVQARAEKKRIRNIRENKLERQSEILTDLLNHRHFKEMQDVIEWKNQVAIRIWGSSLRKNASGNKKLQHLETVDERLQEIMGLTSRMVTATSTN